MNESETIGTTHHTMVQMCNIKHVFLIWHVQGQASAITSLSHRGLRTPIVIYS